MEVSNPNMVNLPQVQQTLKELIECLIKPDTLKQDLFFALLLIVIKENDFVLKENTEIDVADYILAKRRNKREVYEVSIVLNPYTDTPAKVIVCALKDTMLINAIVDATKESYSLCVPINEQLLTSSLGIPFAFSNMPELIVSFKEKIVIPVKSSILNYNGQPSSSLHGLPNDVLFHILLSLSLSEILNVAQSCKKLSEAVKEESLWSRLYRRDFPKMRYNKEADWRTLYKKAYVKENKKIARRRRGSVIEEMDEWPDYMPVRDSRWEVIL